MSISRKQRKRFGISAAAATKHEAYRAQLNVEARSVVEGSEARKQLKRLAEHDYRTQVIPSNDFSCTAYSKRSGNTAHGPVRASGKTDRDTCRYFASKNSCPV